MNTEWLLSFIAFAFATAGTPGPNNLMLAASGATFGLRRTLRHVFGVSLGFAAMIAAVGLGLAGLFEALPGLKTLLKWIGGAYLLFLAWKIATTTPAGTNNGETPRGQPLTFIQAAAFQWVNPKAWSMVLAMMGVYAGHNMGHAADMLTMAGLFAIIGTITAGSWTLMGEFAGRLLSARQLVWFNRLMALLLVASLALMWR